MIGKSISHYNITEKLGEGGMGVVYKAQDTTLDRDVAIKFLPSHLSDSAETKARFIQEAKSAAALNHPNILAVYEIDEQDGIAFLVMEYLKGKTLKAYLAGLKSGSGVPVKQALDWTIQVARGLKAAHGRNIIHRDIKSANIMITEDGVPKVMDFGLAKVTTGASITRTGTSLGTLGYMSPEQAQGSPADERSDIWSLGVVLYEMLTGELPFKAEHDAGLIYLILNEEPTAPSALDLKIPHRVDDLVRKMLDKQPSRRFQACDELIMALNQVRDEIDSAASATKTKAIAVLPFDNISPEKESDYFCDGLMGELIANLSKLKDIRVVSRTSSLQYKGTKKDIKTIGRELGARYLIEGNVRKFGDNLRITAQLIDVETDAQLWAETYKGTMADVFDIQEQVSKQIVESLMVKLTPTEQVVLTKRATVNAEAFDCYLRARDFLYRRTKNNLQFAIQLFQRAIQLDTRYAAAYAGLGEAYATLHYDYDTKEIWIDKALESSLKALMYDPGTAEAYAALALSYFSRKQLQEAQDAAQKAIELGPNIFTGYWVLARIYHVTERDRESIDLLKKTIELNPDFHTALSHLRMVYERLGMKEERQRLLMEVIESIPRYLEKHPDDARSHVYLAVELAALGRTEEALAEGKKALELSPDDPLMLYNAACVFARLGDVKAAVQSLKTSIAAGLEDYEWLKTDPDFDGIRNEPEFMEILKGK
jgi:serine/threonine protein kinase/tetratricopeptide (TPR) repeat protein